MEGTGLESNHFLFLRGARMYSSFADSNRKQSNKVSTGSSGFLARPKLGALKNLYNNYNAKLTMKPLGSSNLDKKKKTRKAGSAKAMEGRRRPDYADTAYREAVGRLRILMAESYTPIKRPLLHELDSAGEETDNQSAISGASRRSRFCHPAPAASYCNYTITPRRFTQYPTPRSGVFNSFNVPPAGTTDHLDKNLPELHHPKVETNPPPELMSFIERQEDYIEQLEKESRYCRDELSALLGKVKDVITENESLHDKQKTTLIKSVFDHFDTETETETDADNGKTFVKSKPATRSRFLEGPSIVFESRISELEAQLTQTKIDLRKALEEADTYRRKMADGSFVDGLGNDNYRKQMETLQREKTLAQETVSKLQSALSQMRDKEYSTSDQMKRSLDVAEQAQYEKSAAEQEIRRLKDEVERQHLKLRDAIAEQSRRVAEERGTIERRFTQQVEQLQNDLAVQWDTNNKLQLELDKQRRENTELRRELAQKLALVEDIKKETQSKISSLQSDIGVSGAEKGALEQQISALQMMNERTERQSKQEAARLHVEMQSLRQRLDRADADLIHSRRENVRLTEQIAALEKEINLNAALNDEKSKRSDMMALPSPKEDKERELSSMVQDMESKHAATVAELEGMIHSQNQLMDKLSNECHALTQKLEDASTRHKEEIRELQTNLNYLSSRVNQTQIRPTAKQAEERPISRQPKPAPANQIKPSSTEHKAPPSNQITNETTSPPILPIPKINGNKPEATPPNVQSNESPKEDTKPPEAEESYPQEYYNNEQYQYDPSSDPQYDPTQYGEMYDNQQYDPNQQYMTQEEYEQQYGAYDPNAQYAENQQYDPNQQQYADSEQYGPQYQGQNDPSLQEQQAPSRESPKRVEQEQKLKEQQ